MQPALAQVQPFLDVVGHPHEAQVEFLHNRGIVDGYGYGIFRPDILINRAEFLKIMMLAVDGSEVFSVVDRHCFFDFAGEEQWYWAYACSAKNRGIIDGYPDGTFRGEQTVILAEALKMAIDAWGIRTPAYPDGPPHWYDPYMDAAASKRIFDYFPYDPGHLLTRSEMAVLIVTLADEIARIEEPGETPEGVFCGNGTVEPPEECDDGNGENGDGCSSICVIVPEPIRHGALKIEQRPFSSLSQSVGSENVELFAFDAIAGRQDVFLTGLKLRSTTGTLAKATNYRLMRGEQLIDTAVPQAGVLAFTDLSTLVQDGVMSRYRLLGDLVDDGTSEKIAIGFATNDLRYVEATGVEDSRELTGIDTDFAGCDQSICWIAVITETAREVTVTGKGNLFVTQDSVPVRSRQLRAGELTPTLLRIKMRAEQENIEVTDIGISGAGESVDSLELFLGSSSTPFAVARTGQCDAPSSSMYCAQTELVVAQESNVTILVKARMRTAAPAEISGDTVALSLTSATTPLPAIQAFGRGSIATLSQNDGDSVSEGEIFIGASTPGTNALILGPTHDVVASNIIAIENSHSDPDNSPVPVGSDTVAAFSFAASPKAPGVSGSFPVTIDTLRFILNAQNVKIDPTSVTLFNVLSPSSVKGCAASADTGAITVTCSNLEGSSVSTVIDQGESISLALRVTITDSQVSSSASTLQVSLASLGDRAATGTVEWNDGATTFSWVDLSVGTVRSTLYKTQ